MPIAEACTLVDASLEHEACACTGRGAEARTYTPLVSRVVITLIAASFGDGLLHLGLASVDGAIVVVHGFERVLHEHVLTWPI